MEHRGTHQEHLQSMSTIFILCLELCMNQLISLPFMSATVLLYLRLFASLLENGYPLVRYSLSATQSSLWCYLVYSSLIV